MLQIRPVDVQLSDLHADITFTVPGQSDLVVPLPPEHAEAVAAEFRGSRQRAGLFELWALGGLFDGWFSEVIVGSERHSLDWSLTVVGDGPPRRFGVDIVDALLVGFHLDLPFFMPERVRPEPLPSVAGPPRMWERFSFAARRIM